MKFEHYLLTRFNLPFGNSIKAGRKQYRTPDWLEMRCDIFERITLPSIQNQTNKNFIHLLLCSTHTPEPYKSRIKSWGLSIEWLSGDRYPLGRHDEPEPGIMEFTMYEIMMRRLKEDTTHLLSSLVDSDDALHEDYVKVVQENIQPDKENIIPKFGLFISVRDGEMRHFVNTDVIQNMPNTIEPVRPDLMSAIGRSHSKLKFPFRYIEFDDPLFVKMVHCGNIMNRLKTKSTKRVKDENASLEKFHMEEIWNSKTQS